MNVCRAWVREFSNRHAESLSTTMKEYGRWRVMHRTQTRYKNITLRVTTLKNIIISFIRIYWLHHHMKQRNIITFKRLHVVEKFFEVLVHRFLLREFNNRLQFVPLLGAICFNCYDINFRENCLVYVRTTRLTSLTSYSIFKNRDGSFGAILISFLKLL